MPGGYLTLRQAELLFEDMPPYIPWHLAMVQLSGAFEILGGLGLLFAQTRRLAAWGLVALLVAVFPANVYMATNPLEAGAVDISSAVRWGRLPLQLVLILWLLWCSKVRSSGTPRVIA